MHRLRSGQYMSDQYIFVSPARTWKYSVAQENFIRSFIYLCPAFGKQSFQLFSFARKQRYDLFLISVCLFRKLVFVEFNIKVHT